MADRRERMDSLTVAIRAALRNWQGGIWTALPGYVVSYDSSRITAEVQPTVQAQVRGARDQVWTNKTLPVIPDVPVQFPAGGDFLLTFPLSPGDEGGLVFCSRCIDGWWQSGGVQPQAENRMHDLSDAFFVPGLFSQTHLPSVAPSGSAAQLRSRDGLTFVEVGGGKIQLVADEVVVHGRNKTTLDAGGTGFVYEPALITTYTDGVAVVHHAPNPPEVST